MADVSFGASLELNVEGTKTGAQQAAASLRSVQNAVIATEKSLQTGLGKNPLAPLNAGANTLSASLNSLKVNAAASSTALSKGFTQISGSTRFLQQGVTQLTGEIPNFFQSARIGFMSIGNNIQPITMAISGLRAENAKLVAEGKPTVSVLKSIGSALFSWQTLLLVGVGIIARYGGELIDMATGAKEAKEQAEALKKSQEDLDKAFNKGVKSVADNISKVQALVAAMTDEKTAQDVRISKYNQLIALYPQLASHLDGQKDKVAALALVINTELIPALRNQAIAQGFAAQAQEQGAKAAELIAKQGTLFDRAVAARKAYLNRDKSATGIIDVVKTELENKRLKEASDAATKAYADNKVEVQKLATGMDGLFQSQLKFQKLVDDSVLGSQTYKQKLEEQLKAAKAVRDNIADASSPAFAEQTKIIEGLNSKLKVYNDTSAATPKVTKATVSAVYELSTAFADIDRNASLHLTHLTEVSAQKLAALKTAMERIGKEGGNTDVFAPMLTHLQGQQLDKSVTEVKTGKVKVVAPAIDPKATAADWIANIGADMQSSLIDVTAALQEIAMQGAIGLAEGIGAAFGSGDFSQLGQAFLGSLGQAIEAFGKQVVEKALVVKGLQDSLLATITTGNWGAAVGIGLAIVAAGAALAAVARKGASANDQTPAGSFSRGSSSEYSSSYTPSYIAASASGSSAGSIGGGADSIAAAIGKLEITGETKIENDAILISYNRAQTAKGR